jgi:hypothetical protein
MWRIKTMRKLMFITIVCAFVAAPAVAGTASFDSWMYNSGGTPGWWGTTDQGWSGTFTLTTSGLGIPLDGVRFETFCVEKSVNVYVPGTYTAVVNTDAIYGNGGGDGSSDPLDPRSAWLYDQWLTGGLTNSHTMARDIAWAIWDIEGEWTLGAGSEYDGAKGLIGQADDAGWTSIHDIRVLNLWTGTTDMQDVLVKVPVPAAVLLGMLGLGAAGMKLRKFV